MRLTVLLLLAACSNGAKRDDAPLPAPDKPVPAGAAPKVHITTPAGEATVSVEIVSTQPRIEKGLMFREHLAPDAGMLFFMSHEHDWSFYMRNTLIPLDMIFITKQMSVAGIVEKAEPRTETLRRVNVPSLYVLEVNGGWAAAHQVSPGAKVRFENLPPGLTKP